MVVKSGVDFNGYTKLAELAEATNIVDVLNGWKVGCGDKLMDYKDAIMLLVKPLHKIDLNSEFVFTGEVTVQNAVIVMQNDHFDTTVIDTNTNVLNFEMRDCVSSAWALRTSSYDIALHIKDVVTLDDFIDDLIQKQNGGM